MGDFQTVARWVSWLRARGDSESTIRLYTYGVFRLLHERSFGNLRDVTEDDVVDFVNSIGAHSVARTHYLRGVRSYFTFCVQRGLVDRDPTAGLKLKKRPHRPAVALDEEELTRLLIAAAWRSPRRAWTLMLSFGLGTRRMELAAIQPDDIQGDTVFLRECKGGRTRRVELSPIAKVALEELRPWYNGTVLGGIRRQTITEWAHQAAKDSGLLSKVQHRTSHVLRASFATYLLRKGTPLEVVRDLLGHANVATTNAYLAVEPEERREAVARLDFGV